MSVDDQISQYLESLPAPRQRDMRRLHDTILATNPGCRLWFSDGKDASGKVVSNPSIGYGVLSRQYADGKRKEMFQVGISANSGGISVYIMGFEDKHHLLEKYGATIGKATVTGYCIKFKSLKDIQLDTIEAALRDGLRTAPVRGAG